MRHETLQRKCLMEYATALLFLVRERGGAGGWPPRDPQKVQGWLTVRLVAKLFHKAPREVALDLIEFHIASEHGEAAP